MLKLSTNSQNVIQKIEEKLHDYKHYIIEVELYYIIVQLY